MSSSSPNHLPFACPDWCITDHRAEAEHAAIRGDLLDTLHRSEPAVIEGGDSCGPGSEPRDVMVRLSQPSDPELASELAVTIDSELYVPLGRVRAFGRVLMAFADRYGLPDA